MLRHVAIIGSGAAGLSAAFHLRHSCQLSLFEKNAALGGHAHTFIVPDGLDQGLALDVAFMVMNAEKYPNMYRLLDTLEGIERGPSEMSFSYCCRVSGTEYALNYDKAGRKKLPGAIAPLLGEILHFCTHARKAIADNSLGKLTLTEYLDKLGASEELRRLYILPMGAALWSASPGHILLFPAELYLRFLDNHALLNPAASLSWQHIRHGSQTYVNALLAALPNATLFPSVPVVRILRDAQGVTLQTADACEHRFDAVIIATHSDQALRLLGDPDSEESALLAAIRYQNNQGVLHWDETVMPHDPDAWASWNYENESDDEQVPVCVSYHLNRLQDHRSAARNYFLTLNRRAPIDPAKVLARFTFEHPIFDSAAFEAQKALTQRGLQNRTCFAGSYLGYGFHEDGMKAGINAASAVAAFLAQ